MKELINKLFHAEPYSAERYQLSKELQNLEQQTNLRTNYHLDSTNRSVDVEILKRNKGLYETIDSFTVNNIKVYEEVK